MLQIELYVDGVEEAAKLFINAFGLTVLQASEGWRHLTHVDGYDIMLFDLSKHNDTENHWLFDMSLPRGLGVEIVINTPDAKEKSAAVAALGYTCSELRQKPWGSREFTFQLKEGYYIRVKQPN